MNRTAVEHTDVRLARVADACALVSAAIGLVVMAGWGLGIEPLGLPAWPSADPPQTPGERPELRPRGAGAIALGV